jgi:hypothetical protein
LRGAERFAVSLKKGEERFLFVQADTFAGANVKEKASAHFVRNDRWAEATRKREHDESCRYKGEKADPSLCSG